MPVLTRDDATTDRTDEQLDQRGYPRGREAPRRYIDPECERCWKSGKVANTRDEEPWPAFINKMVRLGITFVRSTADVKPIDCVRCDGTAIDPNKPGGGLGGGGIRPTPR